MQYDKNTMIQEYDITRIQCCIQAYKKARIQYHMKTIMQEYKNTKIQGYNNTRIQLYTSTRIHTLDMNSYCYKI